MPSVLPFLLLALLAPTGAKAQQPPSPLVGISLGVTGLPEQLVESCSNDSRNYPGVAARLGLAHGPWSALVEASAFGHLAADDCLTLPPGHPDGIHIDRFYDAGRGHGGRTVAFQLRYRPAERWSVGAGAGRLLGAESPFALVAAGLRLPSKEGSSTRIEVEGWAVRLGYDVVTAEWEQFQIERVLDRDQGATWRAGHVIRIVQEWAL